MSSSMEREKLSVSRERAILVCCLLPDSQNNPHDPLDELRALAHTAGAVVVDEVLQQRQRVDAGTFIGSGKVQEIADIVAAREVDVVIFDNDLSPSQIGSIEELVKCKVLDRSELILDIFAGRAQTSESKLQVELAQLEYTYPRLRAMWSHLERITGGAPTGIGTRGPGEQQLEIDRRLVQRRITMLKREIKTVQGRKEREVAARGIDFFTVGLVGYTNAGKSTLFNTLTAGGAYADNKLFATLSTRTKAWELGGGDRVMLSDTVGFIRDLPHHLVASFKATLQEAVHSNLLLVVLDVAQPRCREQWQTVREVLDDIGANTQPRILVLNKIDLVDHNADILVMEREHNGPSVAVSAKTGRGVDELLEQVRAVMRGKERELTLCIDLADGKAVHFVETRATVLAREYVDGQVNMRVRIGSRPLDQLRAMGSTMRVVE